MKDNYLYQFHSHVFQCSVKPPSRLSAFDFPSLEWFKLELVLVMITYTLAGGEKIEIEVPVEVAITILDSERAIRSLRRKERKYLDFTGYVEGDTELYSRSKKESILELVEKLESYQRLYDAIEQLTEIQQRRLRLYFFANLTYKEIALREGVSEVSVYDSVQSAIKKLRKLL